MIDIKKVYAIICFLLSCFYAKTQACGTYQYQYSGEFISEHREMEKIIFPSFEFLNGQKEVENSSKVENYINDSLKFECLFSSGLTDKLYNTAKEYRQAYLKLHSNLPVKIYFVKNAHTQTILIPFKKILLKKM